MVCEGQSLEGAGWNHVQRALRPQAFGDDDGSDGGRCGNNEPQMLSVTASTVLSPLCVLTCLILMTTTHSCNFPGGLAGKSDCLQCGRPRFDPWVGKIPWRRKWHPTPVFLPGESHRRRSLVGCSPRGHKESDTTSLSLSQLPDSYSYPCVTCEETFRS